MNFLFSFLVGKAYASSPSPATISAIGPASTTTSTSSLTDFGSFITLIGGSVVNDLTLLAGAVAVIFLIYYGILYITSNGSPDKAKVARAGIVNAVIGIVVITAAYAIIRFGVGVGTTVDKTIQ